MTLQIKFSFDFRPYSEGRNFHFLFSSKYWWKKNVKKCRKTKIFNWFDFSFQRSSALCRWACDLDRAIRSARLRNPLGVRPSGQFDLRDASAKLSVIEKWRNNARVACAKGRGSEEKGEKKLACTRHQARGRRWRATARSLSDVRCCASCELPCHAFYRFLARRDFIAILTIVDFYRISKMGVYFVVSL